MTEDDVYIKTESGQEVLLREGTKVVTKRETPVYMEGTILTVGDARYCSECNQYEIAIVEGGVWLPAYDFIVKDFATGLRL